LEKVGLEMRRCLAAFEADRISFGGSIGVSCLATTETLSTSPFSILNQADAKEEETVHS